MRSLYQQRSINGWVDPVFDGNVSITGNLSVTGNTSLTGTFAVTGASTLSTATIGTLGVTGNATVTGTLGITGAVTLGTTLNVTGTSTLNGLIAGTTAVAGLTATGTVNFSATESYLVRRYVSDPITQADLIGGASTQEINLAPAFPTNAIPISAYMVTSVETTSSSGDTTGLLAEIGITGITQGYLQTISIFGAASRKQALPGTFLGGFRSADTVAATLTATGGGAEDLGDIDALSLVTVIYYIPATAE